MKNIVALVLFLFVTISALKAQNQGQALLIIDVQNDYFKGGAMELVNSEEAAANTQRMIDKFRAKRLPVIYIQHISDYQGAKFFRPNTVGVEISKLVAPQKDEKIIIKHFPNSFLETELQSYLNKLGVTDLVITGMMTHMCVEATTRAARDLGYKCIVIADACATKNMKFGGRTVSAQDVQTAYLSALNSGYYAKVINTNEF